MTFVYLISAGPYVKVGFSANPFRRWLHHQKTLAHHGPLRFWGAVEGTRSDESHALSQFRRIKGKPQKSELRTGRIDGTTMGNLFPGRPVFSVTDLDSKQFSVVIKRRVIREIKANAFLTDRVISEVVEQAMIAYLAVVPAGPGVELDEQR